MKQAEPSDANVRSVEGDADKSSDRQIRVEEAESREEGVSSVPEKNVMSEGDFFVNIKICNFN